MRTYLAGLLRVLVLAGLVLTFVPKAYATTYYVATTGNDNNPGTQAQPFQTLQKGINTAANGDTVLVAAGTYMGTGNRDLNFNGKNLTLRSQDGVANCILDCQGTESDPHRGFQFVGGETPQAVVEGFTISGGWVTEAVGGGVGGGIAVQNSSPTIRNCILNGNRAALRGGAIWILDGSPTLLNCTFSGNSVLKENDGFGGGVAVQGNSRVTLTDCLYSNNTARGGQNSGGGLFAYQDAARVTLLRCTFANNRAEGGGGVFLLDGAHAAFTSCDFRENEAVTRTGGGLGTQLAGADLTFLGCNFLRNRAHFTSAGMYVLYGGATVKHCNFIGNQVAQFSGGGINTFGCNLTVANCAFIGNTAGAARGGGIATAGLDGTATITNCTFVGNSSTAIAINHHPATITNCVLYANDEAIATISDANVTLANSIVYGNNMFTNGGISVSYCNVEGGYAGTGNINADPRFVRTPATGPDAQWGTSDDDLGDLHLQAISPCINAGSAAAPGLLPYDKDGNVRIVGSAPDMGAFEFGSSPYFVPLYVDKATGSDITGNGTPENPFQTVNKALTVADPFIFAAVHLKAGNYGSDRPRVTGKVRLLNWGNVGQARIGKP